MSNYVPVDFDPFSDQNEIEKIVHTNDSQKEIWLACMLGGEEANLAYNESISLTLHGDFHLDYFNVAIKDLVLRHEALRSTISADGETLIIFRDFPLTMNVEDVSQQSSLDQETSVRAFIAHEMNIAMDLNEGPLFKAYLHQLGDEHHLFTLIKHHVIADGWSSGIMLEDLSKMYNAYVKGVNIHLPKASQLSDYAVAQAKFKLTADYQKTENYWLDLYRGDVPVVDLPTDYPRTSPRSYKGLRIDHPLSKSLLDQLKSRGAKAGGSLVTTLLAAFEIFLYSKTKQKVLVVGLPASGQAASGLFDVVGHCVNLLPIKTTIDDQISFLAYLKGRKNEILDAYDHQGLTFGELIKKLYIKRDSSRITLVPVIFNIDMGMDQQVKFDGLTHQLISNPRAYESFDLYLNATGSRNGAILEWSFNTGLFKTETIHRFHQEFHQMLEQIASDPEIKIAALTKVERPTPLTTFEASVTQNLTELFEEIVKHFPEKTAAGFGSRLMNYRELDERSNQLAQLLINKGVKPGDIIALAVTRSLEMIVALLGILKSGAAYLPLDPEYPKERIEFMLDDSGAGFLLLSNKFENAYKSRATEISVEDAMAELNNHSHQKPNVKIPLSNLAYVLYTSGSTGKPKGVQITHQNLSNFLISMKAEPGISSQDRLMAITTISFDIAGLELYLPLISGATLIIADAASAKDGRLLISLIEREQISFMQATPSTWQMLIDSGWKGNPRIKLLTGGEALSKGLAEELLQRSGSLWNMYGPTETTVWSAVKHIEKGDKTISIGKPILNTSIYILDEQGNRVPDGEIGEIAIRGAGVANGYLNRAELSAEKFQWDPHHPSTGSKIYKTGDLGKVLENGEFQCLGRIDQQVKIRGHRIELGEIEAHLTLQHGIKQSVVLAREDQPGNQRLVAYIIPDEETIAKDDLSWHERWETLYSIGAEINEKSSENTHDLDGTLLNYYENGEDLALQSAEWLQSSISRIKKLKSKRIYEIGSGAGQILYELAPGADYYVATDYAQTAIDKLNEQISKDPQRWAHVKAKVASADDFSQVSGDRFDLVLIHSVAQYFPNANYLIKVIREALSVLDGTGHVFIGDMQGKTTLEMCHAMDHLRYAPDDQLLSHFKQVVANRVRIDDELIADPDFFYALPQLIPEITAVDIQLRKGKAINETTKYHYDVCLYIGKHPQELPTAVNLEWATDTTLNDIERVLYENARQVIEISNILNQRTAKDLKLSKLLHADYPNLMLKQIKAKVAETPTGLQPDLFWELGNQYHFDAHVRWTTDGSDGLFNVVFIPSTLSPALPLIASNARAQYIHEYSRAPYSKHELQIPVEIVNQWKANLKMVLPSYMVPEEFVSMKNFPLTPNAKIDRNAFPQPQKQAVASTIKSNNSITANEKLITKIWMEVLGLENLNVTDDFFQLGGHSLLAMKVMIAIEKETGKRLPLAIFFDNSTIQKIALQLEDDRPEPVWNAIVPIKPSGSKSPLFLIHGGGLNVLLFKSISEYFDEDQPIYGIQALGLNKEMDLPESIEEIAAKYIEEIILVDPDGPYSIAGYSLGGFFAFEMARQLQAMGKTIKMVGIIDTYASTGEKLDSSSQIIKKIKRQFHKVPFLINSFHKYPQETIAYQAKILKHKMTKHSSGDALIEDQALTNYQMSIYEKYSNALRKYELRPQDIEVTLFRAAKRLYYLDDKKFLGWDNYALQGVNIQEIPGDHKTFLYPPNDKSFVEIFQSELNDG